MTSLCRDITVPYFWEITTRNYNLFMFITKQMCLNYSRIAQMQRELSVCVLKQNNRHVKSSRDIALSYCFWESPVLFAHFLWRHHEWDYTVVNRSGAFNRVEYCNVSTTCFVLWRRWWRSKSSKRCNIMHIPFYWSAIPCCVLYRLTVTSLSSIQYFWSQFLAKHPRIAFNVCRHRQR